jgi:peptide-methionine (S)-S-oxide reductase
MTIRILIEPPVSLSLIPVVPTIDVFSGLTTRYMSHAVRYEKATFAAGCFWDVEAAFRKIDGIVETVSGYTGGTLPAPSYDLVEGGTTGHVEAVGLVFNPVIVSYERILDAFWNMHDPTQAEGQGDYTGSQYRTVIFFHTAKQKLTATRSRDRLNISKKYRDSLIVTKILPATVFWPAEDCHQHFYEKCAQGYCTSRQVDE